MYLKESLPYLALLCPSENRSGNRRSESASAIGFVSEEVEAANLAGPPQWLWGGALHFTSDSSPEDVMQIAQRAAREWERLRQHHSAVRQSIATEQLRLETEARRKAVCLSIGLVRAAVVWPSVAICRMASRETIAKAAPG